MTIDTKKTGKTGEDLAASILEKKGYIIVERNYRYGKGEIDLIARDGKTLVFIEVKTRKNLEYGPPEMAITKGKQRQIRKIAEAYLFDKDIKDTDCRIDVVAIQFIPKMKPKVNHILNAF